ncbi:hypothetical protein HDV00_001586 [Rhizophlyctis rosea]|nr:hypothetical protein HDV00_001586 [Rhizophlyctis rosea]
MAARWCNPGWLMTLDRLPPLALDRIAYHVATPSNNGQQHLTYNLCRANKALFSASVPYIYHTIHINTDTVSTLLGALAASALCVKFAGKGRTTNEKIQQPLFPYVKLIRRLELDLEDIPLPLSHFLDQLKTLFDQKNPSSPSSTQDTITTITYKEHNSLEPDILRACPDVTTLNKQITLTWRTPSFFTTYPPTTLQNLSTLSLQCPHFTTPQTLSMPLLRTLTIIDTTLQSIEPFLAHVGRTLTHLTLRSIPSFNTPAHTTAWSRLLTPCRALQAVDITLRPHRGHAPMTWVFDPVMRVGRTCPDLGYFALRGAFLAVEGFAQVLECGGLRNLRCWLRGEREVVGGVMGSVEGLGRGKVEVRDGGGEFVEVCGLEFRREAIGMSRKNGRERECTQMWSGCEE